MPSGAAAPGARPLVLDANILVRAILGRRVFALLEAYAQQVAFVTPELAFADVRRHLPGILARRGLPPETVAPLLEEVLGRLPLLITAVPHATYADWEQEARQRLAGCDEADWPYVALALAWSCPVWTEDQDFFGSGVPTWTIDRVEIYLADERQEPRVS